MDNMDIMKVSWMEQLYENEVLEGFSVVAVVTQVFDNAVLSLTSSTRFHDTRYWAIASLWRRATK